MNRTITFRVQDSQNGQTLKRIMTKEYSMSNSLIKRLKQRYGSILVDGNPQFVNFKVCTGSVVTFNIQDEYESHNIKPTNHPVDIVYEDEDILVVNKSHHTPCHPVKGNYENTLSNYLVAYYKKQGVDFTPRVITRLDNNTSGLVLIAKNILSSGILNEMSRRHEITKKYTAITVGEPQQKNGKIIKHIRRCENLSIKHEVCNDYDGKEAITLYNVFKTDTQHNLAFINVQTLTGRTHQIRVHLAYLGCPLAGDFLYGTEDPLLINRHALHASELQFSHPLTRVKMCFHAPLPDDMLRLSYK